MSDLANVTLTPPSAHKRLAPTIDKQLFAYAAAATAAGVGLFAAPQSAEAKIVYTSANVTIPLNTTFALDLNNDGIADFDFYFFTYGPRKPLAPLGYHQDQLALQPAKAGNEVWGIASSKGVECAAALPPGVTVGPNVDFQANPVLLGGSGGSAYSTGFACNFERKARGAFLGLKFVIDGQTHYGWAHVSGVYHNAATLNGYAYETIPNKPILTGKAHGPISTASSQIPLQIEPATLGLLARGSHALPLWRRPEEQSSN